MSLALSFHNVTHVFDRSPAVRDFSLAVSAGEVVCLLGPSGCGKSTVLRLAAGLEPVQTGRIELDGRVVGGAGADLPPERRQVGLVFQDHALFPHLTLLDNVAFGLTGPDRAGVAAEWLDRVGLGGRRGAYPHELSGGEQQRVALARALAPRPRVMLMDEPFASLDTGLRLDLRRTAMRLLREAGAATLLVTHDPMEAMAMADRLAIMRAGVLVQVGPPEQVYDAPADSFVAGFLGEANLLPVTVRDGAADTPLGTLAAPGIANGPAVLLVRPEGLQLAAAGTPGRAVEARRIGPFTDIHVVLENGMELDVHALNADLPGVGDMVHIAAGRGALRVLPC